LLTVSYIGSYIFRDVISVHRSSYESYTAINIETAAACLVVNAIHYYVLRYW